MRSAGLTAALIVAGCGSGGAPPTDGGAADFASGPADAAPADASCAEPTLPLHVLSLAVPDGGLYPAKLYNEVSLEGSGSALFLVDTGSGQTFLREELGAPPVADAGVVQLGCQTLALPGFAEAPLAGTIDGLEVIGTLGLDRLLGGPSLIDVAGARLTLHPPGAPFPEAAAWPCAPFDLVQETLLAHVRLEGADVRLLVDTGAEHTLWLGQPAQPGDTPIQSVDSAGNPITFYLGTGQVTIGGFTETVPLVRAPSWPYVEQYVGELGGNIAGLLGLSSFAKGLALDPTARTVCVEP